MYAMDTVEDLIAELRAAMHEVGPSAPVLVVEAGSDNLMSLTITGACTANAGDENTRRSDDRHRDEAGIARGDSFVRLTVEFG